MTNSIKRFDADTVFLFVLLWMFGGAMTLTGIGLSGTIDHASMAEVIAIMVFWPLFVLKYLGIGAIYLFQGLVSALQL